jgi:hypothetical protein
LGNFFIALELTVLELGSSIEDALYDIAENPGWDALGNMIAIDG